MNIFNLNDFKTYRYHSFVQKYATKYANTLMKNANKTVEAMSQRQDLREPYRWWDYEELTGGAPDTWTNWAETTPSLNGLLRDTMVRRGIKITEAMDEYGISQAEATQLVRAFVGYHPAYGGYICLIGPYFSQGAGHGIEHRYEEANDKFNYYVWRKRQSTPEALGKSLAKNIAKWQQSFGITFEPSDMKLVVRQPEENFDVARPRHPREDVETLENLDPNDPRVANFYQRSPVLGLGTKIDLNSKGYEKILNQLLGPWYQDVLRQKAMETGKQPDEVANDMLSDFKLLRQVYNAAYKKWEVARDSGEAAALGMHRPPVFLDKSLSVEPGQQGFRGAKPNIGLSNSLNLTAEIIRFLQGGVTDPTTISERLNNDPLRKAKALAQAKRKKKQLEMQLDDDEETEERPLEITEITPEEVARRITMINRQQQDGNKDIGQVLQDTLAAAEGAKTGRGYADMKTAFEMAGQYFSSLPIDPLTRAALGVSNAIVFNPPENFTNYASEDLVRFREAKLARIQEQQGITPTDGTTGATPEQIQRDIGRELPEAEREPIDETPVIPPQVAQEEQNELYDPLSLNYMLSTTIHNLIKIAAELDTDNKDAEAEEVHKVIRKYMRGQNDL